MNNKVKQESKSLEFQFEGIITAWPSAPLKNPSQSALEITFSSPRVHVSS